jgi:hypothetical protein
MRVKTWAAALTMALGLGVAAPAWAQSEDDLLSAGEGVVYKKKTVISFDDDTIDGDLTKPDGAYVESRKKVRHSNLIKIREDFREKILGSISTL